MMEEELPEDDAHNQEELDDIWSQNTIATQKYSIASRSTRWVANSWQNKQIT